MQQVFHGKEIYLENSILHDGYVIVENNMIIYVGEKKPKSKIAISDYEKILPGFIDTHVHGGNGYDVMDSNYKAINEISKYKLREGVTSFYPTTLTSDFDNIVASIENINQAMIKGVDGAKISGIFLEGPYIDKKYRGAHPENQIRDISMEELKYLLAAGNENIKSIAIAPEHKGAINAIKYLKQQGISIRIGHSSATYEQTIMAIDQGASVAIHTYNAMSPFNHRQPGMTGAVLLDTRIYNEIIPDMVHTDPNAIKLLYQCKGVNKIILITDCMMAGGLPDGKYKLGKLDVFVEGGIARTKEGALAGSTLNMISAVKNMVSIGIPCLEAVKMASINPAKSLMIDKEAGSISVGKKADFICADDRLNIQKVYVEGRQFDFS